MMQLVRRYARGVRHRFDRRLRPPAFRNEGNRPAHRVIVAQRGILGAGLGEAMVIYGKGHHTHDVGLGGPRDHPIPDWIYEIGLWVEPRLAALSAAIKALAKLAFSSGFKKLAMDTRRPLEI